MIHLVFTSENKDKLCSLSNLLCCGISGWEAFVNSEVLISQPTESYNKYQFDMLIGPDNNKTIEVDIDIDTISGNAIKVSISLLNSIRLISSDLPISIID